MDKGIRFPRSSRVVFIATVVCVVIGVAASVFVAAHGDNNETPVNRFAQPVPIDGAVKSKVAERFGQLPLSFETNEGQVDQTVKFLSRGPGYDLFLTATEAVLSLRKPDKLEKDPSQLPAVANEQERSVLRLKMLGANPAAHVEGQDQLPGKINYFTGNDRDHWHSNIPTYRKVYYKEVYPGIDIVYYGNQRELEYDFVIAPGADPRVIKFRVDGANGISVDESGSLLLALKDGEVRLNKPFIYQTTDKGGRSEIKGAYAVKGNEISFKVRGFDSRKPLVIDPVLSYSTFLGSSGSDVALSIAVDSQGNAYVTGSTDFANFPTTAGAFRTTGNGGAFVTKLNPTGTSLVYSTFINGGGFSTQGTGIAVDAAGNAYIIGSTNASDIPVVNPLKTAANFFTSADNGVNWHNRATGIVGDVRQLAVTPAALQVIYAGTVSGPYRSSDGGATWTKLTTTGLPNFGIPSALAVSPTNSAVVYAGFSPGGLFKSVDGGQTWGPLTFPVSNVNPQCIVFDPSTPSTMYIGSGNGIFRSLDSGTTWVPLNNFTGLATPPGVRTIAVDPMSSFTIYAGTFSNGLFKTTNGGANWSPINNGLTGIDNNAVNVIVVDPFNSSTLYSSHSNSFAIINKSTNGGDSWAPMNNGLPNGRVTAIVPDRTTANTLYAASSGGGVVKTTNGAANWTPTNIGLWTTSVSCLVAHASNSSILYAGTEGFPSQDAFVTKLNASGSQLLFSTYLGGSFQETGNGIAVDASGNIYVVGQTNSTNFPTVNAIQPTASTNSCAQNGFVTKIDPAVPAFSFSTYLGGDGCENAYAVALDGSANVYITGETSSANFPTANAFQPALVSQQDAFVTKLTSSGSMSYSTYLGGNGTDSGRAIATNSSSEVFIAGSTTSTNFPTANPIQGFSGFSEDAFVTKLNSQGSGLVYSTYIGGDSTDIARGIAIDSTGSAHVVGITSSFTFPLTAGSFRTKSALYKSLDGGTTWSNDNYGLNPFVRTLVVHPTQPATIYAATLRGAFRSTDGGRNWSSINNGLTAQTIFTIIIDPSTPSTLYVASSDLFATTVGVFKSTDGGNTWNLKTTGLPSSNQVLSLAIDPTDPNTLYAGLQSGPGSRLYKTTNGADNWAAVNGTSTPSAIWLSIDPHNHTTLFAAQDLPGGAIFRSVDSGVTWEGVGTAQFGNNGKFVAVSPHTANLVYAQSSAGLFKSVDGGTTWTPIPSKSGKVVFDPVSPSTIYLLTTNEGLQKSTDNGQTWTPLNNGLRGTFTSALAINPLQPSILHLAGPASGGDDAFVLKLNPSGNALVYSTLLGGLLAPNDFSTLNAQGYGIAVDSANNAYVSGVARSPNFPTTPNSFQPLLRSSNDAFITKLTMSYVIRGHVVDGASAPVSGVEVVLNDGTSLTQVITETDGSYEFSRLREGGTYTVSAAKPHFTMTPPSQTFNNLTGDQTLNFTANASGAAFHIISGQITDNGTGLAGVTVTLSGSQSAVRTTDSNGNYSFELVAGGNYVVTPTVIGFTFNPPSQTFNNLGAPQTANFAGTRQNFVVTNTNNQGAGSLREAIINANATAGTDTIVFNIPGPGVKTISLVNTLPEITGPVVIDGTTQPGYAGSPLIEIDGVNIASSTGLLIKAGGTTVRGFVIGRFNQGTAILVSNCNNNVIQGNYIGTDATGTTVRANQIGIQLTNSSNNIIGGTTAATRNVISGNSFRGIEVSGSNNTIQGNHIGTNAAGTAALANGIAGIQIPGPSFTNNTIGGTAPGAGNLISGNSNGIIVNGPNTTIQGNLIGTDVTGTQPIGNSLGILVEGTDTLIGGVTPGARNVISGNNGDGIETFGVGNKVQGNYIGTDITGTLPLGNQNTGVVAAAALIGGTTPEARNIISASGGNSNVQLGQSFGVDTPVTVQGNYIGTDVTGTKSLGTTFTGIGVISSNHIIGGTSAGAQNVISGNINGIVIGLFGSTARGNVIKGNLIGLNAQGTGPLPNTAGGVVFQQSSAELNILGGIEAGAANKIAFNGGAGVQFQNGVNNSARGNSIFSNQGLGIDLGPFVGVTPNDTGDADFGANNLQNFPVITSVSSSASSTTIQGTLNSKPNATYQIDFYSNASVDPSGNGEGGLFFDTTAVTTDGSGNATINVTFPTPLPSGRVISATATDSTGSTSEFSAVDATAAAGSVQFNASSFFVIEDIGIANITVQRVGGSAGSLSVQFETANGTAIAGQDYTATSGTLNFVNGETSKTIQVAIADDATTEPDETFTLTLKNGTTLETLGIPSILNVTIQDRTTVPLLLTNNAVATEGGAGTTTDLRFEVRMSAVTGRTVSVNYATANGTAHGGASCSTPGVDYESAAGTITFQPGTASIFVAVKVCGDSSAEANESVFLNISNAVNAVISDNQGIGTIVNDDQIQLVLEDQGPGVNQAAAVDSLLFVRDPFRVVTVPELFANGIDRNTRVALFVTNLQLNPGETPSAVVVRLIGSNNQTFDLIAEEFRAVPGFDFMQVVFRLPNTVVAGTAQVTVRAHGRVSNMGTIRITQ